MFSFFRVFHSDPQNTDNISRMRDRNSNVAAVRASTANKARNKMTKETKLHRLVYGKKKKRSSLVVVEIDLGYFE